MSELAGDLGASKASNEKLITSLQSGEKKLTCGVGCDLEGWRKPATVLATAVFGRMADMMVPGNGSFHQKSIF